MGLFSQHLLPLLLVGLTFYIAPVRAFGAGNIASISKIEGSNWRHGDVEDTLLQIFMAAAASGGSRKKFSAMDVKRVYFGNWLRDYSQAVDVGSLKYVEAGTIRIILWILGFMTFGYATGEFEVTEARLGCYRPEEHIDNPKDYADNLDAREYDRRLRGPVDENIELGIDPETGLKNYIANERIRALSDGERMHTSAALVRDLFTRSVELGRKYARSGRKEDLYEALRLMGTGLHCLEDYTAHSNYTELALIELGEREIFPHVGRRTMVQVQGRQIYPIVTGTFGGVDFLHSVLGEFSDKAIQSEVSQLETTFSDAANQNEQNSSQHSIIKELMDQLNIGGSDDLDSKASELEQKSAAQKQAAKRKNSPWGLGNNADDVARDLYPFLEFHDDIMKKINAALEAVGIEALVEKLSEAVSIFVYTLIGPFILPLLKQAKMELKTGSGEVIASSENAQHVVFEDDHSSNPTHSMLSKDHFTNLLNEPAGKVASAVLKFVVPLLMQAWDDESIDMRRTCDEIIGGVFHHPAFRNGEDGRPGREYRQIMFRVVEEWWNSFDRREQDELRERLSRQGVDEGRNHNEGVDSGHGCGKPLQRNTSKNQGGIVEGVGQSVGGVIEGVLTGGNSGGGGGGFGSMLGGLAGAALGASFAGDLGGNKTKENESYKETSYDDGQYKEKSYAQERTYGGGDSYGGSRADTQTYARHEGRTSYGSNVPGGFEEEVSYGSRREESHGGRGGEYRAEVSSYGRGGYNREEEEESYSSSGRGGYGSGRGKESYTRTGYSENTPSHSRTAERYTSSGGDDYEHARERRYEGNAGYTEREYERRGEEENYESRRYGEEGEVLEKKHHHKKHHKREDYEEEEEEREEQAENYGRGEGRLGGGGFGGGGYEFEELLEGVAEEVAEEVRW